MESIKHDEQHIRTFIELHCTNFNIPNEGYVPVQQTITHTEGEGRWETLGTALP